MKVPLLDLTRQYKSIKDEIDQTVSKVLNHGLFVLGPEVKSFEEKIAKYCGTKYAIGVASGTDALLLSLRAIGVGPGDEVIVPSFTFYATAGVVTRLGGIPIFVDVDEHTYNIDPNLIEKKITKKTKAIIPVHLFGQCADMDPIMKIAKKHNLKVIEDAAQAISAEYKGKKAGVLGDLGCFSFFPSKNLGGAGDGGMVVTNDAQLAEKIELLRKLGAEPKYFHKVIGYNSRLDTLQAAILEVKLKYLDEWSRKRREHAEIYNRAFEDLDVVIPKEEEFNYHIYNQYTIVVENRDGLKEYLKKNEIGFDVYYPLPMHLQECYKDLGYKMGDLPVSERCSKRVMSLPIYPELTKEEQDFVVEKVREFVGK
jgi:dTDP-4-amino-4,6-dideoxygalactose transaminase